MSTIEISNTEDIIDSRDIIARIAELQEIADDAEAAEADIAEMRRQADALEAEGEIDAADEMRAEADARCPIGLEPGEAVELKALLALADEAEGCSDWRHGETLIRDSYFKEYAQQLAEDMGAPERNVRWPMNCIDWDEAASQLQQDYTSVDFDGETYWIRS